MWPAAWYDHISDLLFIRPWASADFFPGEGKNFPGGGGGKNLLFA
jgi:hypothetical protein